MARHRYQHLIPVSVVLCAFFLHLPVVFGNILANNYKDTERFEFAKTVSTRILTVCIALKPLQAR
jgi:hypothetical protein